jgi:Icc-related predicted phosphoesterase
MRVKILSDLHFENHRDQGKDFISKLPKKNCDVVVIAGDLHVGFENIKNALQLFSSHFKNQKIVYTPGNHEYYNRDKISELDEQLKEIQIENVYILNNSLVQIDELIFLGSTLWFPFHHDNGEKSENLNDFFSILDFEEEVYKKNKECVNFLKQNIDSGSIVVTHHLPSYKCVASEYKHSILNCFFVCEVEELIKKAKVWIHGHTHSSINIKIGNTPVICNPFGYPGCDINPKFNTDCVIEV